MEPHCTSPCPEDCASSHWETLHKETHRINGTNKLEVKLTRENMLTIECGKTLTYKSFRIENSIYTILDKMNLQFLIKVFIV